MFLRSNLRHILPCAWFSFEARILGIQLHIAGLGKLWIFMKRLHSGFHPLTHRTLYPCLLFQHLGTYVVELNFCSINFYFIINFFVVCWSSHTGKNWLWNHGVRWQGNNLFSRAELFAQNIACIAAAGSLARAKFWYRSCEAVGRMGRRRFEIRAFGQLRKWNQAYERLLLRQLIWSVYGWRAWTDLSHGGTMSVQYPGRVFQISSDEVDRMKAKIKPQKNRWTKNYPPPPPTKKKSHAEYPSLKSLQKTKQVWLYFIRRTAWSGYAGTTTNLQIV